MGSPPRLRGSSPLRTVPKPWVGPTPPGSMRGAPTLVPSFLSRILTVGLVCASLYAAFLGAGAVAQDEAATPEPTAAAETATPQATVELGANAVPVARRDRRRATPEPDADGRAGRLDGDAVRDPTAAPTGRPRRRPRTPPPRLRPAETTPRPSADGVKPARKRGRIRTARREPPATARRVARDRKGSASSSGRGCIEVGLDEDPAAHDDDPLGDDTPAPTVRSNGTPTPANPDYSLATPGPAAIGVPNFFIEKFRIPPFLLPIYQAAGIQYGIRWEVLAAISEIETDYGRNLNISSAQGRSGGCSSCPRPGRPTASTPMATARRTVQPGRRDLRRRPLPARGRRRQGPLPRDLRLQPHDWYVESVLMRARVIGGLPADLVGASSPALYQGRFPVQAKATYAGAADAKARSVRLGGNAANVVESDGARRSIRIFSRRNAPVVAVNDGRIAARPLAQARPLRRAQDPYGNTYLYSGLAGDRRDHAHRRSARRASATSPCRRPTSRRSGPPRARRSRSRGRRRRQARRPYRQARPPAPGEAGAGGAAADQGAPCSRTPSARTRTPPAAPTSS